MPKVAGGRLTVDGALSRCVAEIAPAAGIEPAQFWSGFADLVDDFGPRNRALLEKRDDIQRQIDAFHLERKGSPIEPVEYGKFLRDIGYIVPPATEQVTTANVDPEIATIAGPQLVCPVDSARFALNAANARYGSLLDALYGTDAVPGPRGGGYSAERGRLAFDAAEDFLDEAFPLERAASQPKASPKGQQAWLP